LSVGLLNGMDNLLSALYSFPGGYLSDRMGQKRALLVFNGIAILGFSIVILIPSWQAVLIGAIFFLSWSAVSLPATMSLISRVLPKNKQTMGVSMHSLVRRIPMALGPIFGGLCIAAWGERSGVRVAFVFALILALAAVALQQKLIEEVRPGPAGERHMPQNNPLRLMARMSPSLKRLLLSDILIRFCEQIPYAFVVIWCMKVIDQPVSALEFGFLTGIEMVTALLIYIPVAYLADRSAKKPFVVITFVFFTLFPLILITCRSFEWLVPAFVLRGLKEFGEPTRKTLILQLSPEDCKARMFGLYYLLRDLFVSFAAFGGAFLWQISPETNFMVAFLFGAAGTLIFVIRGKDLA
ncbi:MAG: MFS transporter, partial [Pseudomonadota bacterium]